MVEHNVACYSSNSYSVLCKSCDCCQHINNGALYTGVGVYVHIRSRKRLHSSSKGEPTNEAAAEAGQAADTSHCSQPQFSIAQSQLPQGGLFEPVGCPPRLSTPGGFSQSSFMQSITSSKKSRSFMAGKLTPYPAMLGANKTAMHQLESGHGAKQAQQQAGFGPDLIRSGVAQHAQHGAADTQHAEEALSQEAAAAEAALGSFSRASSQTALQSCHTTAAFPLPANAPTDAAAEAAAHEAAHQAAPSAIQRPSRLTLASQQRGMNKAEHSQQVMSQSGRGLGVSQGSKADQPGVLPLQGYPAGDTETGARGLQLTAPNGQSLTQAQVKAEPLDIPSQNCLIAMYFVCRALHYNHAWNSHACAEPVQPTLCNISCIGCSTGLYGVAFCTEVNVEHVGLLVCNGRCLLHCACICLA